MRLVFQAKPIRVEAMQWDGTPAGARAIADAKMPGVLVEKVSRERGLIIATPRNLWLCVPPNGWIVLGRNANIWVYTAEDFAERYEPA